MIDRSTEADSFGRTLASLYRYRELLKNLVLKDLKLKYRGSALGFVWSLANPLLMIAIYTVAFTYILKMRTPEFVFYLMLGVISWTFFSNSLTMAAGAIIDNGGLVKSIFFPRAILPIATVLFNFAQYLLTALVLLPVILVAYHVPLSAPMVLYPVILALQLLFTIGAALILATGTAFFRDIRHFLEVALAALFWLTPIVYKLDDIPEAARLPILLTPMSPYIAAYHDIFYFGRWPGPQVWLLMTLYAAAALTVGAALMLAHEDRFSEQI